MAGPASEQKKYSIIFLKLTSFIYVIQKKMFSVTNEYKNVYIGLYKHLWMNSKTFVIKKLSKSCNLCVFLFSLHVADVGLKKD